MAGHSYTTQGTIQLTTPSPRHNAAVGEVRPLPEAKGTCMSIATQVGARKYGVGFGTQRCPTPRNPTRLPPGVPLPLPTLWCPVMHRILIGRQV